MTLTVKSVARYMMIILAGCLAIALVALTFMWQKNTTISHPLPIESTTGRTDNSDAPADIISSNQALIIIASPKLKQALTPAFDRFKRRYPNIDTHISYIDEPRMPEYISQHPEVQLVLADGSVINKLQQTSLSQSSTQTESAQQPATFTIAVKNSAKHSASPSSPIQQTDTTDHLIQGYVIDNDGSGDTDQALHNTIDNTNAALMTFRQFVLASSVQQSINDSDIRSIDSHTASMDELFNPSGTPTDKNN